MSLNTSFMSILQGVLILYTFIGTINCSASSQGLDLYNNIVEIAKSTSPYAKSIDWPSIKNQGSDFIGKSQELCRGTSAAAEIIFPALRAYDKHSFMTLNGLGSFTCPNPTPPTDPLYMEWYSVPVDIKTNISDYKMNYHGKRLGDIAYIYVAEGFAWKQEEINNIVESGRKALLDAEVAEAKGIIIDLRFNSGGNIIPMLLSLAPILPNDILFKIGRSTSIKLSDDGNTLYVIDTDEKSIYGHFDGEGVRKINQKPVAILINGFTGSSGAITGYVLQTQMDDHIILGEDSSETLSVTESFALNDGNYANIMVERVYDEYNNLAPWRLPADIQIQRNYQTIFSLGRDEAIETAYQYLAGKSK